MVTVVAQFNIEYIRFLAADGNVINTLPVSFKEPTVAHKLYRLMVLTRTFDQKAIALQRTGKLGTYPSSLGQEAVAVGIGHAMAAEDVLCSAYREYGAQLQRGIRMAEILAYWGGYESANYFNGITEDFPMCVPIATQCLHAAGVAAAFRYRAQTRAVVAVCGDGATSQGDFYEAINVAGIWNLPIVFVVNNNQWAISVSRQHQTASKTLAQKAIAAGFPGIQVDGNDVFAVSHVVEKALATARNGGGPTLIEALTYRLHDHTTADDAKRYRNQAEVKEAYEYEPIKRFQRYMQQAGIWTDKDEQNLIQTCAKEVEKAVEEYLAWPTEPIEAMFDHHYANLPSDLFEQRETAIANYQLAKDTSHG